MLSVLLPSRLNHLCAIRSVIPAIAVYICIYTGIYCIRLVVRTEYLTYVVSSIGDIGEFLEGMIVVISSAPTIFDCHRNYITSPICQYFNRPQTFNQCCGIPSQAAFPQVVGNKALQLESPRSLLGVYYLRLRHFYPRVLSRKVSLAHVVTGATVLVVVCMMEKILDRVTMFLSV